MTTPAPPRRVLIVHAHPEPASFTAAMMRTAAETLRGRGAEVVVSDLYAEGFDPVVKAADFPDRRDPAYFNVALEQRHAEAANRLPADVGRELDRLMWADLVILSFPLYWFSVPAMLKGWIDRVLVSGRCYGGRRFYDRGPLAGRSGLAALTMGGRAHMIGAGSIHGPIEDLLKPLLQGTLGYTGMRVLPPYVACHVPYIDDAARRAILADYAGFLERLETLDPLPMPSLDDYDDAMRPHSDEGRR